jgi:TPR repeat protein
MTSLDNDSTVSTPNKIKAIADFKCNILLPSCIAYAEESIDTIYELVQNNVIPIVTNRSHPAILLYLGCYYYMKKDFESMTEYFLMAINQKDFNAMCCLALYYENNKDYQNAIKYYLMASNKENGVGFYGAGFCYGQIKNEKEKIKYYLMAAEKEHITAIRWLISYYEKMKDTTNMIKYYHILIKKGCPKSMVDLGNHYYVLKDYSNMLRYYLMAIEKGNIMAMHNLGVYYHDKADYTNMLKYCLMAVHHKDTRAMNTLGVYYKNLKDYTNMIKYFLMAIQHGDLRKVQFICDHFMANDCDAGLIIFSELFEKGIPDIDNQYMSLLRKASDSALLAHVKHLSNIKTQLATQNAKIISMETYITELELAPGGPKYRDAKDHFESICNIKIT